MADWSKPSLTDLYTGFKQYISDRLDDAAKMFDSATTKPTNQPAGTKRWNSTANKFEKWSGSAWSDLASTYGISISGNAATATTAGTAGSVTTVTLANIIAGLGYTPLDKAGGSVTGALTVSGLITGGAGLTITGNIYASGSIHTAGAAQFDSTLGVGGAVTVGGGVTSNSHIIANNSAVRSNGWGGDYTKGLYYFGINNNYLHYDGSVYQFCGANGGWYAHIVKGGTIAMTSDIPAAGIPYGVGSDSVGATIMAALQGGTATIDQDVSGALLYPCSANGINTGAARSGTWRCRGYASTTNRVTDWLKIA